MSNNSRLVILFIALIGIAGLSFFIFSEDNVDQQSNIQSDAEIQTTTTISNNSTTSTTHQKIIDENIIKEIGRASCRERV